MKKSYLLFITTITLSCLLTGCKTDLMTEVNLSDLFSGKQKEIISTLRVEIASCQSYDDSTKESSSLTEAKEKVASFIPKSEFVDCVRKKMDSYAYFKAPVYINAPPDNNGASFSVGRSDKLGIDLFVVTSSNLINKISKAKNEEIGFSMTEMGVLIKLNNDTESDFKTKPVAVYVDDVPLVTTLDKSITVKKGASTVIRLSDVSVDSILRNKSAPVLLVQ